MFKGVGLRNKPIKSRCPFLLEKTVHKNQFPGFMRHPIGLQALRLGSQQEHATEKAYCLCYKLV